MDELLIPFRDRRFAGQALADRLQTYASADDLLVLALPRGGVPVGFEIARALHAPLDVFVVRKLGHPLKPELAVGAIASGEICILNSDVLRESELAADDLERLIGEERAELERRERVYRGQRAPLDLRGRTVILVDDGIATGASMRAAVAALRTQTPALIVAAAPVGSAEACEQLIGEADDVVCLRKPEPFYAVGLSYDQFPQLTDDAVRSLLAEAQHVHAPHPVSKNPYNDGGRV